jgi:hypothetical protein
LDFHAKISDFQGSDQIDLQNFIVSGIPTYIDNTGTNTGGTLKIFGIFNGNGIITEVDITFVDGDKTTANFNFTSDGSGGTLIIDPPASTTTSDSTVVPVGVATTVTTIETASGQTDVSSPTVDDGRAVALNTTVSDPSSSATTSVTIDGNAALAGTTDTVSQSRPLMIDAGTALECTSISHSLVGTLTNNGTVEVTNPPIVARAALSRDRGTFTVFEGQIALTSIMLVIEYVAEKLKLASDSDRGTLPIDRSENPDATLTAVSGTSTVAATDTADIRAASVGADDGSAAALSGTANLTMTGLLSDLALTDGNGHKLAVINDTTPLTYSELMDFGPHGSSKAPVDALNFVATHSAEVRIAAKPLAAVSSQTTGSDGNWTTTASSSSHPGALSAPELPSQAAWHAAVAIPPATVNNAIGLPNNFNSPALPTAVESANGNAGPIPSPAVAHASTPAHEDSTPSQGAASEHVQEAAHSENASQGTPQSLQSPSPAAAHAAAEIPPAATDSRAANLPNKFNAPAHANQDDAAHTHGPAAESSSTIDTAGAGNAHGDSATLQGAAAELLNDQLHAGNANPGDNGLGHQLRDLPSQAASQAGGEVEDAKGGHTHGLAAKHPSTIDTAGAGNGHGDSTSSHGAAEHGNDQPHAGNANPGDHGLGHQLRDLPSQTTSHAAVKGEDAKGGNAAHTHGHAAESPSTIDTAGAAAAHGDSASFRGAVSGDNDQFHFAYANPGALQPSESPSQAASHAAADIPLTTTDNDIASLLNNLSAPTSPAATDKLAPQAAEHPSLLGPKDPAVPKDGLAGGKGNDQFVFDPGLGHNASSQLDPATDKPHSAQQLFQALDDLLTHAAQAHLDTASTPAEPHDIASTNAQHDKPSTHFIIHA